MAEVPREVLLTQRTGCQMVQVAGWDEASTAHCRAVISQLRAKASGPLNSSVLRALKIFPLAPCRWLLASYDGSQDNLADEVADSIGGSASLVELGAGRCVFTISGPCARVVLAKLLPIDLSPQKFPIGHCAQGAIAHMGVLVHAGDVDTYDIFVYRTYSQHLREVLSDAAAEFEWESPGRAS